MFPLAELDRVTAQVRAQGVALHLEGARLPIAAASAARRIDEFAAPFDCVYLSLWKMLGLPFGAALADSADLLDGAEHDRRRMGGALPQPWPLAVMVLAHLDDRLGGWPQVLSHFYEFRALLARQGRFTLTSIGTDATNTTWLDAGTLDPASLRACARQQGVALPEPQGRRFAIRANIGWLPHSRHKSFSRAWVAPPIKLVATAPEARQLPAHRLGAWVRGPRRSRPVAPPQNTRRCSRPTCTGDRTASPSHRRQTGR